MVIMETVLKIRRLHFREGLSQREISRRLGLNRRTIRKYLEQAEVPRYSRQYQPHPQLGSYLDYLEAFLHCEDKKPLRERLTIRRIYEHLVSEGYKGHYNTVRNFVNRFREDLPSFSSSVFIPQKFCSGEAFQFDWSHEKVRLDGEVVPVRIAHFRLCYSRGFFLRACFHEKLDMVIDVHNHAFSFFGGVTSRGIYDNMKTAVTSIGRGKERVFNEQFLCMANHYLFEPVACTPASGWEKGQVERQVKTMRKRLFEPMLSFLSLEELNQYLKDQCLLLMKQFKHPEYKNNTVFEVFEEEQKHLSSAQPYIWFLSQTVRVSSLSLVPYQTNRYSVPSHYAGRAITLKINASTIEMEADGMIIASHRRSFAKYATVYNPWHYLSALKQKPGALRNGEPFLNWDLPKPVRTIQKHLIRQPKGDRAMVRLLTLIADHGEDVGVTAASLALDEGCPTVEAVENIINRLLEPAIPALKTKEIPLANPPTSDCSIYNSLLKGISHATH